MFDILGYTNYNTFSDKFHIIQTESFVFIANCVFLFIRNILSKLY